MLSNCCSIYRYLCCMHHFLSRFTLVSKFFQFMDSVYCWCLKLAIAYAIIASNMPAHALAYCLLHLDSDDALSCSAAWSLASEFGMHGGSRGWETICYLVPCLQQKHLSIFSCNVLVMYMWFTNLLLVSVHRKLTAYQFLHYLCQLRVASMSW